eukprot:7811655-Pyramimonas_sp.AAC.1
MRGDSFSKRGPRETDKPNCAGLSNGASLVAKRELVGTDEERTWDWRVNCNTADASLAYSGPPPISPFDEAEVPDWRRRCKSKDNRMI